MAREVALNPALVLAALAFCWEIGQWEPAPALLFPADQVLEVSGRVSAPPQTVDDGYLYFEMSRAVVRAPGLSLPAGDLGAAAEGGRIAVYLDLPDEWEGESPASWGSQVRFQGYLREANYFAVPGVDDARRRLRSQGILAIAQLKSPRQIEILERPPAWKSLLSRYQNRFQAFLKEHLSDAVRILVEAGFLGDRREMPVTLREALRDTGLVHLFSVSGFHVTLILAAAHWIGRFLGRLGYPLSLLVMWTYILMIGMPLTALRAGLMNTIGYGCWVLGSRKGYFNTLGLVALCLFWLWPGAARSSGFHFSFLALLCVGIYSSLIFPQVQAVRKAIESLWESSVNRARTREASLERRIRFGLEQYLVHQRARLARPVRRRAARALATMLHLTLFAIQIQVVTLPLTVYYSNRVAWTQLPANLLLNPLFSLFLLLAFLAFALYWFPLAWMVLSLLEGVGRLWIWGVGCFADLGWVSWLPHPSAWAVFLWILLILSVVWTSRRSTWGVGVVVVFLLCQSRPNPPAEEDGDLQVTLLDVGQGDCLHLKYPDGSHALIDTGGLVFSDDPDYLARTVVGRYFWQLRLRRIRYLMLTHNDLDHVQGTDFLTKAFSFQELLVGFGHPEEVLPGDLTSRRLREGEDFGIGGVTHRILNPPAGIQPGEAGNEESLVVEVIWRGFRMLLTGDIGEATEQRLIDAGAGQTLLKIPHHGSRRSSSPAFLSAFPALLAIVSAGRRNPFGHPSPQALDRYFRQGVEVYSTNDWGAIRFRTDGSTWMLSHYSLDEGRFVVLKEGFVAKLE